MRGRSAVALATGTLIVLALSWSFGQRRGPQQSMVEELAHLRYANTLLQRQVAAYAEAEQHRARGGLAPSSAASASNCSAAAGDASSQSEPSARLLLAAASASNCSAAGASSQSEPSARLLLDAHRSWDWRSIVDDFLLPWPSIHSAQLDAAVASCNGSAMYCQRFQIHNGKLYITDYAAIFFDRHYAPARVMPLLDTLRRHPDLPNLDLVVAGNDEPRVHAVPGDAHRWSRMCDRYCGPAARPPPALFSSTTNRAAIDLPYVDFAWFFPRRPHKLRTPPWAVLHPKLHAAGGSVPWASKIELAMHTGNVGSAHRKALAEVSRRAPSEILVNELFIGDHRTIRQTCAQLGLHRKGGFQQHKCYMTFEDQVTG